MLSQRFLRWPWQVAVATGVLLTAGSSLWRILGMPTPSGSRAGELTPAIAPLPQDLEIQVFFNHSEASVYTDPYRQIERYGDDLEAVIITAIEQAETSIDLAVQALNLPRVASALAKRHREGLKVRVILENQYANPTSAAARTEQREDWLAIADSNRDGILSDAELSQANALGILSDAQVPLIDDTADGSKGSGLMHHKFLIIDSQRVITGSANFTLSGIHGDGDNPSSRGNANALLKIENRAIAEQFTQEFNLMWGDGPAGRKNSQFGRSKPEPTAQTFNLKDTELTLQFSPQSTSRPWHQSTNGLIGQTLSQSERSIDL
ncbi:MAG: phospholipase D-like domain-containing protein, partial [Cyanobacteria bacterium J06598_3]